MKRYKAIISYDGGSFFGWQYLGEKPTVEEELTKGFETILQHPIPLEAASRTDAGVHAHGQVIAFNAEKKVSLRSINSLTSESIVVREIEEVKKNFHPTLDCKGKHYRYCIFLGEVQYPQYRDISWHIKAKLNLDAMKEGAEHFIGSHNFRALCNFRKDLKYSSYERHLYEVKFLQHSDYLLSIDIKGEAFLYKMVRNIVGTLVDVGRNRLEVDAIPNLLKKGDRKKMGVTAPAHGLSLMEVFYDEKFFEGG